MLHIVEALRRSAAVTQVQVLDFVDEATVRYLKCRADLAGGSTLHIEESIVAGKTKYSYHWQDLEQNLIIRWDNAPHYPHLASFPCHRHEGDAVHESPRVSIEDVLATIEMRLAGASP